MKPPAWPTPQEYNEAIQNPGTCFDDPELREGQPTLTPLGLPKPITGAFASVYEVACGDRRWAVRCFLREYADQRARYAAIGEHLRAARLPFMVAFEYLERGILVGGAWRPILKMEWIDGEPLNIHVGQYLDEPGHLLGLARQWIEINQALRQAGIAHGDLQHGNILVGDGKLRLIDYDAMFVPALAGLPSHEEGHRNYQHPTRSGRDFHPELDHFSAWVILDALLALAVRPKLWGQLGSGEEWLLYRREDFVSPDRSEALRALRTDGHHGLALIGEHFRAFLDLPADRVPGLDGVVPAGRIEAPLREPAPIAAALPTWLSGQLTAEPTPPPAPASPPSSPIDGFDATTLLEHLSPFDPRSSLPARSGRDRLVALATGTWGVLSVAAGGLGLVALPAAASSLAGSFAAAGAWFSRRYQGWPAAADRTEALRRAHRIERELRRTEQDVARAAAEHRRASGPVDRIRRAIQREEQRLDQELGGLGAKHERVEARFARRREEVDRVERRQIGAMEARTQREIDALTEDRNSASRPVHQWTSGARRRKSKLGRTATSAQVVADLQNEIVLALEARRKARRAASEEFAEIRSQLAEEEAGELAGLRQREDALRTRSNKVVAELSVRLREHEQRSAQARRKWDQTLAELDLRARQGAVELARARALAARYEGVSFRAFVSHALSRSARPRPAVVPAIDAIAPPEAAGPKERMLERASL